MLNEKDLRIIEIIERSNEFEVKRTGEIEKECINKLGIHILDDGIPIFYDHGALKHFLVTKDDPRKTKRLTPSQTIKIIKEAQIILPNFDRGSINSYMYVGKLGRLSISIVEVLIAEKRIRVTHGGFEVKDRSYLDKAKELRNTILEGRPQK